jgi:hypothetical protein
MTVVQAPSYFLLGSRGRQQAVSRVAQNGQTLGERELSQSSPRWNAIGDRWCTLVQPPPHPCLAVCVFSLEVTAPALRPFGSPQSLRSPTPRSAPPPILSNPRLRSPASVWIAPGPSSNCARPILCPHKLSSGFRDAPHRKFPCGVPAGLSLKTLGSRNLPPYMEMPY